MTDQNNPSVGVVEKLLRRDQAIVVFAASLLIVLAGLYTVFGVGMNMSAIEMTKMARPVGMPMEMGGGSSWTISHTFLVFSMWWIMMIAMMTPGAAPLLLLFTVMKKRGADKHRAALHGGVLLTGYLAAWAGFSALATGLQWGLEHIDLLNGPMMTIKSRTLAGLVLILAGLYQFSGLKDACLSHCRAPGQFLAEHHRPGLSGSLRLGLDHGAYCLGCCWILMALLFVGGVMNLYWIVGLTLYVLVEKYALRGQMIAKLSGLGLIVAGGLLFL